MHRNEHDRGAPTRRHFLAYCAQWLGALATLPLANPSRAQAQRTPKPLIVASHPLVADWVRNLIGTHAVVHAIAQPQQDLHSINLHPAHLPLLRQAVAIVAMGLGTDAAFVRDCARLVPDTPRLALGDLLAPEQRLPRPTAVAPDHDHAEEPDHTPDPDHDAALEHHRHDAHSAPYDPHFWLDPERVAEALAQALPNLIVLIPSAQPSITAHAHPYLEALRALAAEGRARLTDLPATHRKAFVMHDAYRYLNAAFGIELIGIDTIVPHGEITPQRLLTLKARAAREGIRVLFTEAHRTSRVAQSFAERLGLTVAGPLYPETFAPPPGPATYLDLMRHNLTTIATALRAQ
ncbi:metal ABC transporter substrate-binding protein [Hydrogenophilus thiooxidans]|uniref:metal ABC transporter substrate-binding protein n=1 Tax=Hydrogenophilus thiooxidans TaxID=2820326 RepID=UPI001C2482B7|nr:metal ABC transporter substrate-binding protein [Hydrogenophilus thiooxidans]